MSDPMYEKCADCHLFVELNASFADSTPEFPIAEYVHLHRGDVHDEALDATHEARSSGILRTLNWWKDNGPYAMRARFDPTTHI